MATIVELHFIFERTAKPGSRKGVVKLQSGARIQKRIHVLPVEIETGSESTGASEIVKRLTMRAMEKWRQKADQSLYVVARFENDQYRTVVSRRAI